MIKSNNMNYNSYEKLVAETIRLVDQKITDLLPHDQSRISQAMRYSALSTGKRLRPFILICTANIFDVKSEHSIRAAAAVEIIHSYSLIHDDLPAMDDDDLRRGMPSCHKKFDEATAILAGDALLTLAFEVLSDEATHPDATVRCELIKILASSIGSNGMAGGQMLDLIYEKENIADYSQLIEMQYMKTAKLFMACCEMGAALGYATTDLKNNLLEYGRNFGLAFQFIDDLEDIPKQIPLNSNNIVQLIGEKETFLAAKEFIEKSRKELKNFADKGLFLDTLASKLLDL